MPKKDSGKESSKNNKKLKVSQLALGDEQPRDSETNNEWFRYSNTLPANHADDPLAWWRERRNEFPVMATLARKYLACPATSAPCERLWSVAGVTVTAKRGRLAADKIEKLVFAHENM